MASANNLIAFLTWLSGALLFAPLVWALLYYCVMVTRDYRLRRRFFDQTADLEPELLYEQFRKSMWIAGLYAIRPFRPAMPHAKANRAIILSTVLRERICLEAGVAPPRSYLRSRRELIRAAKSYVAQHR